MRAIEQMQLQRYHAWLEADRILSDALFETYGVKANEFRRTPSRLTPKLRALAEYYHNAGRAYRDLHKKEA